MSALPPLPHDFAALDTPAIAPGEAAASAVLVALLDDSAAAASAASASRNKHDAPQVILTERAGHLRNHAGQISFPGGRMEPGESAREAALREAEEEVGLARDRVEVLGYLPGVMTGAGFHIAPVLGRVLSPHDYIPKRQESEVARILIEPLLPLLDPANHRTQTMPDPESPSGVYKGWQIKHPREYIWGATARLIVQWAGLLYPDGRKATGKGDDTP